MTRHRTGDRPDLKLVNPNAAAIDIGSTMHMAAVNPDVHASPVRAFGEFTQDLNDLVDWFRSCGVTTVAMESTAGYWIPAFEILEADGREVILVNARYAKKVPGRCERCRLATATPFRWSVAWQLQTHSRDRHATRLYAPARRDDGVCGRAYPAHAEGLMEMNLQLHHFVSDTTGATGIKILCAIVAGERDPDVLAEHRDVRCKSSIETIKAALIGNDRNEHVFALTQSLELYDLYKSQIATCDAKLEDAVGALTVQTDGDFAPIPKARFKGKQRNAPAFDIRVAL